MQQRPLTVLVPIDPTRVEALKVHLRAIGKHIDDNDQLTFPASPSTHFCRFVVLEHLPAEPRLLFSSNYDGTLTDYADELAHAWGTGLDTIWRHCHGYAAGAALDARRLLDFVLRHQLPTQAFYCACPGATVRAVHDAAKVRERADAALDGPDRAAEIARLSPLVPHTRPPVAAAGLPPALRPLARAAEYLAGIRKVPPELHRRMHVVDELADIEDHVVQNQMTVVSPIKDRRTARGFVRLALLAADALARRSRESLSGVSTIHFARWVLIDDGRWVLFESNYDGSWERYIDDFVDFASEGMNMIWGTAEGFPKGGCRDIEAFKAIIRRYQRPTQVFYSAYPYTTVVNKLNDLALADALRSGRPHERVRRVLSGSYASG